MRNLKRVLSLSLASIMLLGMMVIGSSAAQDYTDVDYDNDNVEAIEVLDAINVMRGDLDANGELAGTFRPGSEVKRSEMARIMAFLMDLDYDYYIGANPFNDMVGHWAEKYAAACAATGIIYGRGNGIYDPDATVTAVEAASMLLRALGYFQNPAVDQPNGFVIDTIRQAGKINLFNKVDVKTDEPMTRNDVAQLVLNALQSGMVEPSTSLSVTTPDGFTVSASGTNYVYRVARNDDVGRAINDTKATEGNANDGLMGFVLDLGEQLYNGKLKLNDDIDVFGRPARTWEFDGAKVGTYVKDEQLRTFYTGKVTGRDLVDLLTASTIEKYEAVITVDGETRQTVLDNGSGTLPYFTKGNLIRANTEAVGATARGVRTEVYVDSLNEIYYIAIINTYLVRATRDYNTSTKDVVFNTYGIRNVSSSSVPVLVKNTTTDNDRKPKYVTPLTVENEDIYVEDVKKDDIFLAHVADGEIQELIIPNVVSDTVISSFKLGSWVNNGTEYNYANTALYNYEAIDAYSDANMKQLTYNIILDEYDNLIGLERNEDPDQYVFITGIEAGSSNLGVRSADMNAIFLDGTMGVITVDMVKSAKISNNGAINRFVSMGPIVNTWCKYSVASDGTYTLTVIPTDINGGANGKVAQWAQNVANGLNVNANGIYPNSAVDTASINGGDSPTNINSSYTIDKGHMSLLGNGATDSYNRVYGTDKTVYINVKLGYINLATTGLPFGTGTPGSSSDGDGYTKSNVVTGNGLGFGIGNADATAITDGNTSDLNYINNAYGNDNLVAIINDVDSVTVGVRNADIEVYDLNLANSTSKGYVLDRTENVPKSNGSYTISEITYPKSEIYTLYNKDGDVIAAITIGDDQGTSTKMAYFYTDSLVREAYPNNDVNRAAGEDWYWSRMAIIDGEKVELTEVGDTLTYLGTASDQGNLRVGSWAEVRFDADGNVRSLNKITATNNTIYFSNDPGNIEDGIDGNYNTILIKANYTKAADGGVVKTARGETDGGATAKLSFDGGSLWITTGTKKGWVVATDVKTVLALTNGTSDHDDVQVYYDRDGLEQALNSMHSSKDTFNGYLSILVENEVATMVVLDDRTPKRVNQGSNVTEATYTELGRTASLTTVRGLLSDGKNVRIPGDWNPSDANSNDYLTLDIPEGTILSVGSFTNNGQVKIKGAGTLKVDTKLDVASSDFFDDKITVKIEAENLDLKLDKAATTISGNMTISNQLTLTSTDGRKTLTIAQGTTVDITNDFKNSSGYIQDVVINGTLKTHGSPTGGHGFAFAVNSTKSLYIDGTLSSGSTVTVGSSTNAGYAKIGTLDGGAVVITKIGSDAPAITTVKDGTITLSGDDTALGIGTINAAVSNSDAAGKTVTILASGKNSAVALGSVSASSANTTYNAAVSITASGEGSSVEVTGSTSASTTDNGGATVTITASGKDSSATTNTNTASATSSGAANVTVNASGNGASADVTSETATGSSATVVAKATGPNSSADVGTMNKSNGASASVEATGSGASANCDDAKAGTVKASSGATATVGDTGADATLDTDNGGDIEVTGKQDPGTNTTGSGNVTNSNTDPSTALVVTDMFFVFDKASYEAAVEKVTGLTENWTTFKGKTNTSGNTKSGTATLPWLFVGVTPSADVKKIEVAKIEISTDGGATYTAKDIYTNNAKNYTDSWQKSASDPVPGYFHWEMTKNEGVDNSRPIYSLDATVTTNSYYRVTLKITTTSDKEVNMEVVKQYTEAPSYTLNET